jgi:outer membrane lipoprotein-sorting protein
MRCDRSWPVCDHHSIGWSRTLSGRKGLQTLNGTNRANRRRADGAAGAMQIADGFGQTAVLSLSSFERNPKLDSDLFQFVTPKGADLLQDR